MDILIKNISRKKVEQLRQRAKRNHRSLRAELLALIDEAVAVAPPKLSIEQIASRVARLGLTRKNEAVRMVREDRGR